MATNYKIGEVVEIIAKAEDGAAMTEVGRRFPIMTVKIAKALAGDQQSMIDLFNAMPDYVTALKVSNGCKDMFGGDEVEEEEEEEKPKKSAAKKAPAKKSAAKKAAKKPEPEPEEEDEDDGGKYDGKTPKELYAECKKRGLDVEPRKAAKVYIEALEADDADDGDEEEEEWDI